MNLLRKGLQGMLLILKKKNFYIKSDSFTKNFPFRDIYLFSKKLLKFWHFVFPQAPISLRDMLLKKQ